MGSVNMLNQIKSTGKFVHVVKQLLSYHRAIRHIKVYKGCMYLPHNTLHMYAYVTKHSGGKCML